MRASRAAPSAPPRWLRRTLQSRQALHSGRRPEASMATPKSRAKARPSPVSTSAPASSTMRPLASRASSMATPAPPAPRAHVAGSLGEHRQLFEQLGYVLAGEGEIAVTPLMAPRDQPIALQL